MILPVSFIQCRQVNTENTEVDARKVRQLSSMVIEIAAGGLARSPGSIPREKFNQSTPKFWIQLLSPDRRRELWAGRQRGVT
jgi:hypothetical protein